jgi:hypothetical protein
MYTSSSNPMVPQEERDSSKTFSGKLPFRTKPEIHEDIFFAAKQAGKSINAWMEDVLKEAAKQKQEGPQGSSASNPSQSLQQLFQDRPDTVFELIDNIKPELKSHKTRDTVVLIGEVEKLVTGFVQIRAQLSDEDPPDTVELLKSATYSCFKKDESIQTKDPYQLVEIQDCLVGMSSAIIPRLKRQDTESFLACLSAFGQFLISFVAISHHLKDDSIENTFSVMKQVFSQLFP